MTRNATVAKISLKHHKLLTKKNVVVLTVLGTEDLKAKHAVEKRASDGMFKHHGHILTRHLTILVLVWNQISAETQIKVTQFGATQQMYLQDLNIATQMIMVFIKSSMHAPKIQ